MDSNQCGTGRYNVGKSCTMMLLQAPFMMLGFMKIISCHGLWIPSISFGKWLFRQWCLELFIDQSWFEISK